MSVDFLAGRRAHSAYSAHILSLLAWSLIWALFFYSFLNGADHFADGDFSGQFHASAIYQGRTLWNDNVASDGFLWSPVSYAGFPFAADPQTAVFYPPRWLTLLLARPWDFSMYALQVEALLHVWLAGVFTYFLAFALSQRHVAALLAALAFGLGGYLTSYPIQQLAVLESVIWLPLILLLLRRGVDSTRPVPWLVGAGFGLALSALAGHPQSFLHVSYMAAAYFLFLTVRARWSWGWVVKLGGLVMGTAIGVAAVALLPTLHFMLYTTRRSVNYSFTSRGLPLEDYVQLILPALRSHWTPEYSGMAALLLLLVAWYGRRARNIPSAQTAEIYFWSATALLAGWLAMGDNGILFQLAYGVLPGFRLFQQQERLLSLVSLSVALLLALGLSVWTQTDPATRRRLWQASGWTTAVFLLLAALYAQANPSFAGQPWPALWLRQAAMLALIMLLLAVQSTAKPRQTRFLLLLFIPLLAADLYVNTSSSVDRHPGSPDAFWPQDAWLQQLRAEQPPLARIDSQNLLHANLGAAYDLEDIHGISPLKPIWLANLEQLPRERRWQLLGVTHVLDTQPPMPGAQMVAPLRQNVYPERTIAANLYRLPAPLPRAWLSYQPVVVADETTASQTLASPEFDPAQQVVLHTAIPDLADITPPSRPPTITTWREGQDGLRIDAQTDTPAILVISEWRYPGWRAWLNGQPADLFPTDYAFLGLRIPAGRHEVKLQYQPWDVPVGAALTVLTLVVAGWLAWRWRPVVSVRAGQSDGQVVPSEREERPSVGDGSQWQGARWRWSQWQWRLAIGLLVWLAFGLRLHTLGAQDLRGDEVYGFPFMGLSLTGMLQGIAALGEEHPPLHYIILHSWIRVAGDSEFAMRFLAVIPAILVLPVMWQLGRRWHGRMMGFFVAALMAVSQSLVWLGQDVRNQYVMVILCGALATWFFQRALDRPRWIAWVWYALLCALTMYSHYYGIFALLAHGVTLLVLPNYRRHLPAYVLSGLAAAALFAPWLFITFAGWVTQLSAPSGMELAPYLQRVGQELVAGAAFPAAPGRWLFLGALLLAARGWWAFWQRDRATAVILGVWLGGALGGVFLVLLRRNIFNPYYVSPAAPAWWALVAMGIITLAEQPRRWAKGLALGSALALFLAAAVSLGNYYGRPAEFGRNQGYRALAAHVADHYAPNDLFLANFPDPSFVYYLRHLDIAYTMQPATLETPFATTEQALAGLVEQYDRLWFVPEQSHTWDTEAIVYRWLDYHTLIEENRQFDSLNLILYRPAHAVDDIMTPVGQSVGSWARLEGYYITVDGVSCHPMQPGAEVTVTLIWRAISAAPTDYTAFVHLLGTDGRLLAQHDGVPVFGTRPTTTWQPGERLLDRHTLTIPPTAVLDGAELWVGLYDSQSIERLRFDTGQDALRLELPACTSLPANK